MVLTRLGLGLAATVMVLAAPALRGQQELTARFIGNMAWAISDGALTLMSDFPYDSGAVRGYMTYDATAELRSATPQTLSLITHRHADHWSPTLFARTDWIIHHHQPGETVPECSGTCYVPRQGETLRF